MRPPTTAVTANSHFCWRGRRSQTTTATTRLRKMAYWATREMSVSIVAVYVVSAKDHKLATFVPIRSHVGAAVVLKTTGGERCCLVLTRAQSWCRVSSAECRQSCRIGRHSADCRKEKSPYAGKTWCPRAGSNSRHQV